MFINKPVIPAHAHRLDGRERDKQLAVIMAGRIPHIYSACDEAVKTLASKDKGNLSLCRAYMD